MSAFWYFVCCPSCLPGVDSNCKLSHLWWQKLKSQWTFVFSWTACSGPYTSWLRGHREAWASLSLILYFLRFPLVSLVDPMLRFLPPLSVGVFTALHFIPTVAYLRAKSSKVQLNPCYPLPPGFGSLPTLFTPRVLSFFFSFLFFQFIVICRGNYLLWAYSSMLETESQFVCLFGRLVYARLIFWNSQMYQSFPLWLLKLSLCLKLPSPPCEYLKRNVFSSWKEVGFMSDLYLLLVEPQTAKANVNVIAVGLEGKEEGRSKNE